MAMNTRDEFARAILANLYDLPTTEPDALDMARGIYTLADAMMEARKKPRKARKPKGKVDHPDQLKIPELTDGREDTAPYDHGNAD